MTDTISFMELLSRARDQDRAALDCLFASCREYLVLAARARLDRQGARGADPSDLVQQTLMEAYVGFPRFRGTTEAEWLCWLRRILAHNAVDVARQKGMGQFTAIHGEDIPESLLFAQTVMQVTPETPSQYLLRKEQELSLADAIRHLPDDYRQVIYLRNLQRLPFEDVARQMNRSRPAVQMLWMRALQRLRELLAAEG